MTDKTHSEDCWRWHLECAVAKIERLSAEHGDLVKYAKQFIQHENGVKFISDHSWSAYYIFKDAVERADNQREDDD